MITYSKAEIAELRKKPANTLTGDELWGAYSEFAVKITTKIVASIGYAHIDKEELLGTAYEIMVYSASRWKENKAKFGKFYAKMLKHRLHREIWLNYGVHLPKPRHMDTPHELNYLCLDLANDEANNKSNGHFEIRNKGASIVGEVTETQIRNLLGSHNFFTCRPEQLAHARILMRKVANRIRNLKRDGSASKKLLAERMKRIFVDGELVSEVAESEGVTPRAVQFSVREGRFILQDLIGLPKADLLSPIHDRVKNGWTRKRAEKVNELPVKKPTGRRPKSGTKAARLLRLEKTAEARKLRKNEADRKRAERNRKKAAKAKEKYWLEQKKLLAQDLKEKKKKGAS